MVRNLPTTEELKDNFINYLVNEIRSKIDSTITADQIKSVLRAIGTVDAGVLKILYLFGKDIRKNILPLTADSRRDSTIGSLEDWGFLKLRRYPRNAEPGTYNAQFTGDAAATLSAGAQLINTNTDIVYIVQSNLTVAATGKVNGQIKAATAGTVATLNAGDVIQTQQPYTGINENVTILSEIAAPIDEEDIEVYRKLVVDSFSINQAGGTMGDYRQWGKDAVGVSEIYPYLNDTGTLINLYVKGLPGYVDVDQITNTTVLDDVEEVCYMSPDTSLSLRERERAPLNGKLQAYSVSWLTLDITITGLTENTTENQSAMENAANSYIDSLEPFIDSIDLESNRNDKFDLSELKATLYKALPTGVTFSTLTATDSAAAEVEFYDLALYQGRLIKTGTFTIS
jgi:hypothetical protein